MHHPKVNKNALVILGLDISIPDDTTSARSRDSISHDRQIAQEMGLAKRSKESAINTILYYTEAYAKACADDGCWVHKVRPGLFYISRSSETEFARWINKLAKQQKEIEEKCGEENETCIAIGLGDSLIEQMPTGLVNECLPPIADHYINCGLSGDSLFQVIWRAKNLARAWSNVRLVLLLVGTDDIAHYGRTPEEIVADHVTLWQEIKRRAPQAKLLVISLLPRQKAPDHPYRSTIRAINQQLRSLCAEKGHAFIDLHDVFLEPDGRLRIDLMPDELHLNESGYRVLLDGVAQYLELHPIN